MSQRLVLLGAGGHARVVMDAVRSSDAYEVGGYTSADDSRLEGAPYLGTDDVLPGLRAMGITHGVVAVGSIRITTLRRTLFERIVASGLRAATIVHRDATISPTVYLGEGTVVFARAVVNPKARLGRNVIVNTGAIVEHECEIEDDTHLSPGVILGGAVRVGRGSHIGIGATVMQGIRIGDGSLIGAGAVVVRDVPQGAIVAGVPARPMR